MQFVMPRFKLALMLILPLNVGFILVQEADTFILRVEKVHILPKHDITPASYYDICRNIRQT